MVTMAELFACDDDSAVPAEFPNILIELDAGELRASPIFGLLQEGKWGPSMTNGLWVRVDPSRPDMKQKRHVHVAQRKHLGTATKQVSWNDDGSRHDRRNFNPKFGTQAGYRAAAAAALGLGDDIILEEVEPFPTRLNLIESLVEMHLEDLRPALFLRSAGVVHP